jgi:hypothetical protein
VDEESLEDPIVRTLIFEVSLRKRIREIQADQGVFDVVLELFKLVSPRGLHELAVTALERGDLEVADDLDWLAGLRERGELPEGLKQA